jgi:hypothetical protein
VLVQDTLDMSRLHPADAASLRDEVGWSHPVAAHRLFLATVDR